MKKIKTSIIIPSWNTKILLQNCINSIIKNTKYFEIIIVDNGSTDGTVQYLNSIQNISNIKVIYNSKNLGFSKANNQGAEISKGKFLCFLNSDIIVEKMWLEEMYKTFSKSPYIGAVGPLANPAEPIIIKNSKIHLQQHKNQFAEDTIVGCLIGFCLLLSKSLFLSLNGWDEDFDIGNFEDTLLSYKIRYISKKKLAVSVRSKVNHLHPSSTFIKNNIELNSNYEINKKIFFKKLKELKIYEASKHEFDGSSKYCRLTLPE